jgi:hypothetical protein
MREPIRHEPTPEDLEMFAGLRRVQAGLVAVAGVAAGALIILTAV